MNKYKLALVTILTFSSVFWYSLKISNKLRKKIQEELPFVPIVFEYPEKEKEKVLVRQENLQKIVCFNQTSGDLITVDKQRQGTINKFKRTNQIGGQRWINKWSK